MEIPCKFIVILLSKSIYKVHFFRKFPQQELSIEVML